MDSPPPLPDVPSLDLLTASGKDDDTDKKFLGLISVTASTDGFWGDEEFQLKNEINKLKRKFHEHRTLRAKFLPTDVSDQEIKQMLSDFPVAKIQHHRPPNTAGAASISLEDPELFEDWDENRVFLLRGQTTPVSLSQTQSWVCVSGFPRNFPEKCFAELVRSVGEVRNHIYMVSEKTRKNKGYGLADYETREKANAARDKLKDLKLGDLPYFAASFSKQEEADFPLWTEIVHPKCVKFENAHSKCLHISNLPPHYKDMAHFRKMFSVVAQPPYCQIAMKNGCPLSWGLVEYSSSEDAELTFDKLYGMKIGDRTIRICYYSPGVRAIHLYTKLCAKVSTMDTIQKAGNGLLPDPPAPDICHVVEKLKAQNPVFALNLEHILYAERLGKPSSQSSGSESEELGIGSHKTGSCKEMSSRTPSPASDLLPLHRRSVSPNLLPTPEDSAGETSPTENRVPMMPYTAPGLPGMHQASLHQMMAAAQHYGNDPCEVAGWPFRNISMLPVFTPFGVQAPGMYPMPMPMVPQPIGVPLDPPPMNPPLPPTEPPVPVINFTNKIETMLGCTTPAIPPGFDTFPTPQEPVVIPTPITPPSQEKFTPPKKPESSPETSDSSSSSTEETLNTSGIRNLWGANELNSPVYNRLAPNGLLEKVANLSGGIWAPNTSPPSLKRRCNVWPIKAESEFLSVTQSKRPRND